MTTSPHELELTPDLLDYAKAVALTEARKRCPKHVDFDDVAQDALLHLMSKPPRYDPSRGASVKTLIYTVVQRAVLKHVARHCREAERFPQFPEPVAATDDAPEPRGRRTAEFTTTGLTTDDVIAFIDNEDSRALCRLYIECNGNASETARLLGMHESTVRYRLKMLAPKLLAAGFDPFAPGGGT